MDFSTFGTTLFYFDRTEVLSDFESFDVYPMCGSKQLASNEAAKAEYWTLIGKYKSSDETSVIADLPLKLYAKLFAEMCLKYTNDSSGRVLKLQLPAVLNPQTA